jgi:hypothetical protein
MRSRLLGAPGDEGRAPAGHASSRIGFAQHVEAFGIIVNLAARALMEAERRIERRSSEGIMQA